MKKIKNKIKLIFFTSLMITPLLFTSCERGFAFINDWGRDELDRQKREKEKEKNKKQPPSTINPETPKTPVDEKFHENYGKYSDLEWEIIPEYNLEKRENIADIFEWFYTMPKLYYKYHYNFIAKEHGWDNYNSDFYSDFEKFKAENKVTKFAPGIDDFFEQNRSTANKDVEKNFGVGGNEDKAKKLKYSLWKNEELRLFTPDQEKDIKEPTTEQEKEAWSNSLEAIFVIFPGMLADIYDPVLFDEYAYKIRSLGTYFRDIYKTLTKINDPNKTFASQIKNTNLYQELKESFKDFIDLLLPKNYPSIIIQNKHLIKELTGLDKQEHPFPFFFDYKWKRNFSALTYKKIADFVNLMIWINTLSDNPLDLKQWKPDNKIYGMMEKYFFNYEERIEGKKAGFEMNIKIDWDITKEEAAKKLADFLNKQETINIEGETLKATNAEIMALKFSTIK